MALASNFLGTSAFDFFLVDLTAKLAWVVSKNYLFIKGLFGMHLLFCINWEKSVPNAVYSHD
jgi:hypothetical protein